MKKFFGKIADILDDIADFGGEKMKIISVILSGIALLLSFIFEKSGINTVIDLAWVSIILCGIPIVLEALAGLFESFDVKADLLVAIALIAAICIGEFFAAGEVAFIMQLGEMLEDFTVSKARAGIEKLIKLTPKTARVIYGDEEKEVDSDSVKVGDLIRVLPGETVPVDGVIIEGKTSINQAVMTGESLPIDKTVGDDVKSGTVNLFGAFIMRAEKVGENSSLQRMIKLVQSADAEKSKIVGIADRWATWIVVIALLSAAITFAVSGEIIRAVTILVVFCPCSLVLATPTAIMAAIGNVTKHGFLVKEGDALERLSKVKVVAFDKTGTLTYGKPQVSLIKSFCEEYSDNELFSLLAGAEKLSEHPLGKAITTCYKQKYGEIIEPENFNIKVGKGVSANVDGKAVLAGNIEYLSDSNIIVGDGALKETEKYLNGGSTVIYIGVGGVFAGYAVLSDKIREESPKTVQGLKALGITPVLLTGDNLNTASEIAGKVGIKDIKANLLPEDKLMEIKKAESLGSPVCMIGDGINDAPALKSATASIAMGKIGSDIAIDAADIALVDDEVKELPHLFAISKRMIKTIAVSITASMAINIAATVLAAFGVLSPVVGALVHNLGAFLVVANSALLITWKGNKEHRIEHK